MAVKEKIGIVVNNLMDKTVVIAVENKYPHPIYGKTVKKTKRFMAHDEENKCKSGDLVLLEESSPISKNKKWVLKEILKISEE